MHDHCTDSNYDTVQNMFSSEAFIDLMYYIKFISTGLYCVKVNFRYGKWYSHGHYWQFGVQ